MYPSLEAIGLFISYTGLPLLQQHHPSHRNTASHKPAQQPLSINALIKVGEELVASIINKHASYE